MGDVVDFSRWQEWREDCKRGPCASGEAVCLGCRYRWHAVAPLGTTDEMQCPSCETNRGVFDNLFWKGNMHRVCNCGNDLFRVTPDGYYCARCGTDQK